MDIWVGMTCRESWIGTPSIMCTVESCRGYLASWKVPHYDFFLVMSQGGSNFRVEWSPPALFSSLRTRLKTWLLLNGLWPCWAFPITPINLVPLPVISVTNFKTHSSKKTIYIHKTHPHSFCAAYLTFHRSHGCWEIHLMWNFPVPVSHATLHISTNSLWPLSVML